MMCPGEQVSICSQVVNACAPRHEVMDKSIPDQREGQRALPYPCKGRQLHPCAGGVSEEEIKWIRLSSVNLGLWTLTYSMLSGFMGQYFAIPFLVKTLVVISGWRVNCLYSVNVLSSISQEKKKFSPTKISKREFKGCCFGCLAIYKLLLFSLKPC